MDLYSAKQALCGEKWIHTEGKRLVMVKNGSIQKHTRLVVVTNRSIEKQIRLTVEVRIRFYVLKVAILTKFFTSKLAVVTKMLYL